ncbi:MAG: glutamate--tRNA ligase [Planctomycetaceae bacterium]|nr:glutamate--tRNA ligase [Planctomycetaceae bacterium]
MLRFLSGFLAIRGICPRPGQVRLPRLRLGRGPGLVQAPARPPADPSRGLSGRAGAAAPYPRGPRCATRARPRPRPRTSTVTSPSPLRVRFAPSPTGKLHVGGARTALFNWAFARRHGGTFLLRIEDTDRERSKPEYERAILEGLSWLGIQWDEGPDVGGPYGPYRQMERSAQHVAAARELEAKGAAYRCFCTTERLDALREAQAAKREKPGYDGLCRAIPRAEAERRVAAGEPAVLRFRVPEGHTQFVDLIRGDVTFQNAEVDDWVMVRTDGAPTYNFVVVCDDSAMAITHVLRGEEHLTNTPKQVLLYHALGYQVPRFGHFPLMLGTDGKKLSKRTGDTALEDYRDKGFPKEAVLNFLCLQGWALDGKTEVFGVEDLVANFDPTQVSKAGSIFDIQKFLWLSGEYIRRDSLESVADHCAPHVVAKGWLSASELQSKREWYLAAVATEKERIHTYAELAERIAYLFAPDDALVFDDKAEANGRKQLGDGNLVKGYVAWLTPQLAKGVEAAALRDATKAWMAERGAKFPALFQPLRCALTGEAGGPDLFDVMALLGPERTLARIESGIRRLSAPATTGTTP